MTRYSLIYVVAIWALAISMIFKIAGDQPVSEKFWINLAYFGGFAFGTGISVLAFVIVAKRFAVWPKAILALVWVIALVAFEYFWLHDAIQSII